jgi:hypothetical protein
MIAETKNRINIKEISLKEPRTKGGIFPFDPKEYFTYEDWQTFQMDAAHSMMDFNNSENEFDKYMAIKYVGHLKLLGQGTFRINSATEFLEEMKNTLKKIDITAGRGLKSLNNINNIRGLRAVNYIDPQFDILNDSEWGKLKEHFDSHTSNVSVFNTAALVAQIDRSRLPDFMPDDRHWDLSAERLIKFSSQPFRSNDISRLESLAEIKLVDPSRFDRTFLLDGKADGFIDYSIKYIDSLREGAESIEDRRLIVQHATNLFILSADKIVSTDDGLKITLSKRKKIYSDQTDIPERRRF